MSSILKTLAVVSAVTVGGAVIAHQSFAADFERGHGRGHGWNPAECGQYMGDGYHGNGMHRGMHHMGMMRNYDPDRVLSADDIRVLTQAHLIRMGNPNLKVGDIKTVNDGNFMVRIVAKDGSIVNEQILDKSTGMPTEMMKRYAGRNVSDRKGVIPKDWRTGRDLNLSEDDVETLTEARLIRMGNKNLKVDDVSELKNGNYQVKITTKSGAEVNTIEIDKATGRPVGDPDPRFGRW